MLSEEEKAQLEVPFVGRDGSTRKLEVRLEWCIRYSHAGLSTIVLERRSLEGKS